MTTLRKLTRFATAAAVVVGALMVTPSAQAQGTKCLPREALIKSLESKYKESLNGGGLQNANQMIEVWASPDTGSFTVFITRADGVSCIMATGRHWNSAMLIEPKGVKS